MARANYGVIVIGGGHAGVEAASASARLGVPTLLVTPDLGKVGEMSCNPAIGGVAKGVVAREVDALGGVMGRATDAARIHFRMLNTSKGPAVWSPRAQCDRGLYPRAVRRILDGHESLDLFQEMVVGLRLEGGRVRGIVLRGGRTIEADAVVVTAGTFLRGRIHVGGEAGVPAGRAGEAPSVELAEALAEAGVQVGRFKTGTPPRVDGRSVDFARLEEQVGDPGEYRFGVYGREVIPPQRSCWVTWAGEGLKEVVRRNLERSALYGGAISGEGPRYCPSIEDKIVRFPDARRHQVFLEPEGLQTTELYVNGVSTSLPYEVQEAFLRTIPGLEEARITKMGYAIEYDFFPPTQLRHTLESRVIGGLYFAGQVNGTTGYEEAAGQGVVAGANAALAVRGEEPLLVERHQGYLGVLVDDLVTKGVDEPYRLFTSRAEYRLLLRQDNAVERLGPMARERGLLLPEQVDALAAIQEEREVIRRWVAGTSLDPEMVNPILEASASDPISQKTPVRELVKRPGVSVGALLAAGESSLMVGDDAVTAVEMEAKYAGYIRREKARAEGVAKRGEVRIPEDLSFGELVTLSTEARQKLDRVRPDTLAQAARIPGISPADVENLLMELRRRGRGEG